MPAAEPDWRQERRRRILDTAAQAFAERPYAAVQMGEVAKRVGIGKPTLYRYYRSKEDLYIAAFEEILAGLDHRLAAIRTGQASSAGALAEVIGTLVEVLAAQVPVLRALEGDQPTAATRWRSVYRRHRQVIDTILLDILRSGIAAGEFRAVDEAATAALLLGMIRGGLTRGLPKPRLIAAATDFALAALQKPPVRSQRST